MRTNSILEGLLPFGKDDTVRLDLIWDKEGLPSFFPLLQQGVLVRANLGVSVRKILCEQLGVSSKYLDERINTIFLNGSPVDEVDTAVVAEGSTLGLSAALPGFVGAALRKGGFYSRMRMEITHSGMERPREVAAGFFVLKLYNMVLHELGPFFLDAGFWMSAEDLIGFLSARPERFWDGFKRGNLDGRHVDSQTIRDHEWSKGRRVVFLTVKASPAEGP